MRERFNGHPAFGVPSSDVGACDIDHRYVTSNLFGDQPMKRQAAGIKSGVVTEL
ncbi:hypothetical protein ACMX25_38665 [Caballeronia sp. 15715]|uniref:hypothetical protein n=1 Tax=Caballeronia sp. 15715 TaxID=3391030 RepID=UPI0039E3FEC7